MKTIQEAITERGPKWGGMFEALYWNEAEGYYFAKVDYRPSEFICLQNEYEAVAKEISTEANRRNIAQMVELNELCQQHGIGKIGDSVVPALKTYIKNIQGTLDLTERLIISEIGEFTSTLGHLGSPETPEQIHEQLMARIRRVFADVKQQGVA